MSAYTKLDHPLISQVLFHPRVSSPPNSSHQPRLLTIPVNPTVNLVARFHCHDTAAPTILFFHGNGEIGTDYDLVAPNYLQLGLNLIVVDYRGYGDSSGTPSASTMLADCHTIFSHVQNLRDKEALSGPLFLMGRSLGSACAIELAAEYQDEVAGLIIDSGFASTVPLLQTLGVAVDTLDFQESDGFNNSKKIAAFTKPTFILHAQHDQIIPLVDAERLQAQCGARSKEFQIVPGADHNSILDIAGKRYFSVLQGFINKTLTMRPRRKRQ